MTVRASAGLTASVEALACLRAARRCEQAELARLIEAGAVVLATNALVHALQRERGATSAWLAAVAADHRSSRESPFRAWLEDHRGATDEARDAFDQTLADRLEARGCDSRLYVRLALALDRLAALPQIRDRVDRCNLEAARAAGAYTRVIHALLDVVFEVADGASDPPIARALAALFQFALGKEQSGQERAIGAAALARGRLDDRARNALRVRIDAQEQCFAAFTELADATAVEAWNTVCVQPCVAVFERLRRELLTADPDRARWPGDIAERWFQVASERIDAMKAIEDALERALEVTCAERLQIVEDELQAMDSDAGLDARAEGAPQTPAGPESARPPPGEGEADDEWPRIDEIESGHPDVDVTLSGGGRTLLDLLHAQSGELRDIRRELDDARRALAEGKVVQRAKALLMRHRGLTEDAAHQLLRRTAMAQNRRMVDVAAAALELADVFAAPKPNDPDHARTPERRTDTDTGSEPDARASSQHPRGSGPPRGTSRTRP